MNTLIAAFFVTTLLLMPGTSNAALIDLGDGTVRDDATNLVWLRNWDVNGQHSGGLTTRSEFINKRSPFLLVRVGGRGG